MYGGTIVDRWNRRSGLLESQAACSHLLQPAGRTILSPTHHQEDRVRIGWTIESSNVRRHQSRFRQEGIAAAGSGRDVLYAVKARAPKRSRRALASPPDVFRSPNRRSNLGRK